MLRFLDFFFDEANLYGWIKDEWYKTYDRTFVDSQIISQLKRHEAQIKDYITNYLGPKDRNALLPAQPAKSSTTEVKPFNLTKPKPRAILTPEKIPSTKVYKPVPKSTYVPPPESDIVKTNKETLRLRAEKKLQEAERLQFSCANTEKSLKTKIKVKQILEEREAALEPVKIKPRPFPTSMLQPQQTKLNTAAILREGARIQKESEDEDRRLADLEAGQKDSSGFEKWQEDMRQKDKARQLAEAKKKHLESKLSYEEAIIAKESHIQKTREKVHQVKEEYEQIMAEYFSRRDEEKKKMRRLVEEVMEGHHSAQEARVKLQQMKHRIVEQVDKESQELMARALEETEEEMKRKVELIQRIRAMESVPVIRTKFVDLTETSGQGLLSEMSVAELRERLSFMKIANDEEKERKKKEIAITKKAKEQLLTDTLQTISRHKSETSNIKDTRQTRQQQVFQQQMRTHDKELAELNQRLEARKNAKEKLKDENAMKNKTVMSKLHGQSTCSSKDTAVEALLRTTAVRNS